MKYVLVNYNFKPHWVTEYTDDYLIYDRSDTSVYTKGLDPDKIIKTKNLGNVDYDKLSYIVQNYDNLPEVFLLGKTNLFKYITKEEFELVKDNKGFTPLLTKNHRIYCDEVGQTNYYSEGMYYERNDNWYANQSLAKHFRTYKDFAKEFQLPNPIYVPFSPGGSYILTREVVHRYSKDYYKRMAKILPHTREPREAFFCERSYFNMWKVV